MCCTSLLVAVLDGEIDISLCNSIFPSEYPSHQLWTWLVEVVELGHARHFTAKPTLHSHSPWFFNHSNISRAIDVSFGPAHLLLSHYLPQGCLSALAWTRKPRMHLNQVCCTLPLQSSRTSDQSIMLKKRTGQEKQAKLLASDTGHFSMIRFGLLLFYLLPLSHTDPGPFQSSPPRRPNHRVEW